MVAADDDCDGGAEATDVCVDAADVGIKPVAPGLSVGPREAVGAVVELATPDPPGVVVVVGPFSNHKTPVNPSTSAATRRSARVARLRLRTNRRGATYWTSTYRVGAISDEPSDARQGKVICAVRSGRSLSAEVLRNSTW